MLLKNYGLDELFHRQHLKTTLMSNEIVGIKFQIMRHTKFKEILCKISKDSTEIFFREKIIISEKSWVTKM